MKLFLAAAFFLSVLAIAFALKQISPHQSFSSDSINGDTVFTGDTTPHKQISLSQAMSSAINGNKVTKESFMKTAKEYGIKPDEASRFFDEYQKDHK